MNEKVQMTTTNTIRKLTAHNNKRRAAFASAKARVAELEKQLHGEREVAA